MRICSRCAAPAPSDEATCLVCGGATKEAIREEPGRDESRPRDEAHSFLAPTTIPDLNDPAPRQWVEVGFVLGCACLILLSLAMFSSWWNSNDGGMLVGALFVLICSPFAGLLCGIALGHIRFVLAGILSLGTSRNALPRSALAKTDSRDRRARRRNRNRTNIRDATSLSGEKDDPPEVETNCPRPDQRLRPDDQAMNGGGRS